MTPKEKALDLVHKFAIENKYYERAQQCALICINEMIRITLWGGDIDGEIEDDSKEYYIKVKQEIEKL